MPTSQRARLAAFKDMHASQNGSGEPTIVLSDAEAIALIGECEHSDLVHFDAAVVAAEVVTAVGSPPDIDKEDALADWAARRRDASARLWDALSGTPVDGVILTRKRS